MNYHVFFGKKMAAHTTCEATAPEKMQMKRTATAIWSGDLKTGKGLISTETGVLKDTQFSFGSRFESGIGTNPEELIAAAHAGCFSMALSAELGGVGIKPEKIETAAAVMLEKAAEGFAITHVHLDVTVTSHGSDAAVLEAAAARAKAHCPVSKVLNAKISMDAKFQTETFLVADRSLDDILVFHNPCSLSND